jgi:phenylpyruvate tautomerase PptA (4-oxalocrotonate tautomerase family)
MPYLQLDVPEHYPVEVKRDLARRLGDLYARIMQTTSDMVRVAFRELGEGGVWHCGAGAPEPAAVLLCDIRRGRPPEQRLKLAEALVDACTETLGLRTDIMAEFTQHPGDESFGSGFWGRGFAPDWTSAESTKQSGK